MLFRRKPGFTLLELLLVIAVISIVVLMTLPLSLKDFQKEKVKSSAVDISSNLYLSQQNAYSGKNNKNYGLHFQPDRFYIFVGDSFGSAESTEEFILPQNIFIQNILLAGGGDDVVFLSGNLKTNEFGSFELTNSFDKFLVVINREGLIYFEKQTS